MLDIKTTSGEIFTAEESCALAKMIYKRYGYDVKSAAAAWRRMLQNSCPDDMFEKMVRTSRPSEVHNG